MYKSFLNVKKIVTSQFRLWKEKKIFFSIFLYLVCKKYEHGKNCFPSREKIPLQPFLWEMREIENKAI